jgi:hypothetical protein
MYSIDKPVSSTDTVSNNVVNATQTGDFSYKYTISPNINLSEASYVANFEVHP